MSKEPISVFQLTQYIKLLIQQDEILSNIIVRGEISNFKHHSSGHMYFTLKDDNSKIRCVMFRSSSMKLKFIPEDGMNVIIVGSISLYEKDGQYQLYCTEMQPDGIGSLYLKLEQLKDKLQVEGLFSPENKKPLPILPRRVGVVTSQTGAVIRDIINVSTRRFSNIDIILYPAAVQGDGAAETIAEGINFFNQKYDDVDVIIVGRGGGSIEELWPFNEEIVARAIYGSKIPVVSAVGHETDYTICDFAADVRASTPSHAAEIVVPVKEELINRIDEYLSNINNGVTNTISNSRYSIQNYVKSIKIGSPYNKVQQYFQYIDNLDNKIIFSVKNILANYRNEMISIVNRIDSCSPAKIIMRGYASVEKDGKIVRTIKNISKDDVIQVFFNDGKADCKVIDKMEGVLWQEEKRN